jgi:hypothetical protein
VQLEQRACAGDIEQPRHGPVGRDDYDEARALDRQRAVRVAERPQPGGVAEVGPGEVKD